MSLSWCSFCIILLLIGVAATSEFSHGRCKGSIHIEPRHGPGSSWVNNGIPHQIYDIHVTNYGDDDIEAAYAFLPSNWRFELEGYGHPEFIPVPEPNPAVILAHDPFTPVEVEAELDVFPEPLLIEIDEPLPFTTTTTPEPDLHSNDDLLPELSVPASEDIIIIEINPKPVAPIVVEVVEVELPEPVFDADGKEIPSFEPLAEPALHRESRSYGWPKGGVITQIWNYDIENGEILNFGDSIVSGQTWSGSGFIVAGSFAHPYFAFVKTFCSRACVPVVDEPEFSIQSTPLSVPFDVELDIPAPTYHPLPLCTARYTRTFFALAFSPSTGRHANSTSHIEYPIEQALRYCSGHNDFYVDDCVIVLSCVDCFGAISITNEWFDGQYLATVATGLSDFHAQELAREQCECLTVGSGLYCS